VSSTLIPRGLFMTRTGTIMAAADSVTVTVRGAGGHGSLPHRAKDPVPAACEMVLALQTMITRRFDVFDPVVLTVGAFHAGTAENIIPGEAVFGATLRSFSPATHAVIKDEVAAVVRGVASAHGLTADISFDGMSYPVTVNNADAVRHVSSTVREVLGEERYFEQPQPIAGAEDFSLILDEVPGAMVILGACPPNRDPKSAPANHAADATFDDAVLTDGATVYSELAMRHLTPNKGD
ncbi:M20 metallopeptidase family protein, partial [Actinomadura coerulea]|uniref:M20 metallopeptidase family protein n=1 Tax=Actinomadura coerulea TaxID=46159 RepID=UPI00343A3E02